PQGLAGVLAGEVCILGFHRDASARRAGRGGGPFPPQSHEGAGGRAQPGGAVVGVEVRRLEAVHVFAAHRTDTTRLAFPSERGREPAGTTRHSSRTPRAWRRSASRRSVDVSTPSISTSNATSSM